MILLCHCFWLVQLFKSCSNLQLCFGPEVVVARLSVHSVGRVHHSAAEGFGICEFNCFQGDLHDLSFGGIISFQGSLSKDWVAVTKSAIAEAILSLTKLDESLRLPSECVRTPTVCLLIAVFPKTK